MPTTMLTGREQRRAPVPARPKDERAGALDAAAQAYARRVRRLKVNVAAWLLGSALLTLLWAVNQARANGGFESFGHEGEPGQWNPTLWAVALGGWTLVVGVMALGVYFGRPITGEPLPGRGRLERARRLRFHAAAWVLGMLVLTPLWALIEWQDNGAFQRWSDNSRPGDWEPWILYVGGIWALAVAVLVLRAHVGRRTPHS